MEASIIINNKICNDHNEKDSHYHLCFYKNHSNPNVRRTYLVTNLMMLSRLELNKEQIYLFLGQFKTNDRDKVLSACNRSLTRSGKDFEKSSNSDKLRLILQLLQLFEIEMEESQVLHLTTMISKDKLEDMMSVL